MKVLLILVVVMLGCAAGMVTISMSRFKFYMLMEKVMVRFDAINQINN